MLFICMDDNLESLCVCACVCVCVCVCARARACCDQGVMSGNLVLPLSKKKVGLLLLIGDPITGLGSVPVGNVYIYIYCTFVNNIRRVC